MNYENQQLIDMLAAEYVLGTLKGAARNRFSRLTLTSTRAREAMWMWEQYLNSLASSIKSVPPDEHVWQRISARIDPNVVSLHAKPTKPKQTMWQAWSLIATAACVVLAFLVWQPQAPTSDVKQIALFKNQSEAALWFIDVTDDNLAIKASSSLDPRTDRDYELWMILKGQDAPISLGLLPKSGNKELLRNSRFKPQDIALLAVSLEPLGGSPTGSPTEVLYTTELVLL
ncbi:anti-sigma factor [Alteromonadaceae bacterium BrNp21-10]|nr:anti-sigma factor [Alteromonadaceae bacterium BrNp21-10]